MVWIPWEDAFPRVFGRSVQAGYVALVVDVDLLGYRHCWEAWYGHHLARQRHDESGSRGQPHFSDGQRPTLRGSLDLRIICYRELRLSHADRAFVVPRLLYRGHIGRCRSSLDEIMLTVVLLFFIS